MTSQPQQRKLGQEIWWEAFGDQGFVTVRKAGERVARFCHGRWDWQGVRDCVANTGLKRSADKWLRENNVSSGKAIVLEFPYGDGTSRYCAAWKE